MSSTIVLTPKIREIPYFSSFSLEEDTITIPRPLINETIYAIDCRDEELDNINFNDLVTIIENCVYLGVDVKDNLVKELMWHLGETEEKLETLNNLPDIVQREVKSKLFISYDDEAFIYPTTYSYNIRCKLIPFKPATCYGIAIFGNLRLLKWAYKEGCRMDEYVCINAAINGSVDMLQFLHSINCLWSDTVCASAAEYGHLETLKYLHENGCPWDTYVCSLAAKNGHLDVLKYLHENNCPWDITTFENAVVSGHLNIVEYMVERGFRSRSTITCRKAAENGHLEILKFLRKHNCPWDVYICANAACNGYFEVVKWAHENGCPWSSLTYINASCNEFNDIIEYCEINNCPKPIILTDI